MKCKLHVEFNYIKSSFFKERIKKGKGLPQVVHILLHSLPYSGDDTSSKRLTLYEQPLCDGLFLKKVCFIIIPEDLAGQKSHTFKHKERK